MQFHSHTWRLGLSTAALITLFILSFMLITGKEFVANTAETTLAHQRQVLKLGALAFERRLEQTEFDARAVLSGLDQTTLKLNPATQRLFWENPNLSALELRRDGRSLLAMEKSPGLIAAARRVNGVGAAPDVRALGSDRFAVALQDAGGQTLRFVMETKDYLPVRLSEQIFVLSQDGRLLTRTPAATISDDALGTFLRRTRGEASEPRRLGRKHFVLSSAKLKHSRATLTALTPVPLAINPLAGTSVRLIAFVLGALLAGLSLSLLLARRLKNAFEDEMNGETAARVHQRENEVRLATANEAAEVLHANIYPQTTVYRNARVELTGSTSARAQGEWFFFYQQEFELYVFVARAEGRLAPLLLTASKACLSAKSSARLSELARAWDRCVVECSRSQGRLRAQLVQINVELGTGRWVVAGTDDLLHGRGQTFEVLAGERHPELGTDQYLWLENEFQLNAGERLRLGLGLDLKFTAGARATVAKAPLFPLAH